MGPKDFVEQRLSSSCNNYLLSKKRIHLLQSKYIRQTNTGMEMNSYDVNCNGKTRCHREPPSTTLANACCILLGHIVLSRQGDDVGPIENVLLHVEISFRMWMKQKHVLSILVICFFVSSSFRSSSSQFCTEKACQLKLIHAGKLAMPHFFAQKKKPRRTWTVVKNFQPNPVHFPPQCTAKGLSKSNLGRHQTQEGTEASDNHFPRWNIFNHNCAAPV